MSASLIIRPVTAADRPELRKAVVELQDYEHRLHMTRLPGERIADMYLDWMLGQANANGAVLVAECGGRFVGFVSGWIQTTENIAETPEANRFGYISDICILPAFRGQRIASRLLHSIEQILHRTGAMRLRISALALNTSARTSYQHAGFAPYEILYEKLVGDQIETG
jgi:ribosomal protein S18 acetylase RimI-like enzyme